MVLCRTQACAPEASAIATYATGGRVGVEGGNSRGFEGCGEASGGLASFTSVFATFRL